MHYESELAVYNNKTARLIAQDAAGTGQESSDDSDAEAAHAVVPAARQASAAAQDVDPPFPPNDLVPYRADIFGLDKARKDCRFEMIKIVREVCACRCVVFV